MILAGRNHPAGSLPFYTFGSMYRDSFDVQISRQLAVLCQQPHHVLSLNGQFLSRFAEYAEKTVYLTDGYHDACGSYELYLNRLAREIAPIRLTGDFGGEVLRGVSHFKAAPFFLGPLCPELQSLIQQGSATLAEIKRRHPLSFAVFNEAPWSMYGCFAIEQSQVTLRSPYLDNDLVGLMYCAPANVIWSNEMTLRFIRECNPSLLRIRTDRGVGGNARLMTLPVRLYREFLFKAEYYSSHGTPGWLAAAEGRLAPLNLETLFLGRHKFYHYRKWLRDELAGYVREILLDKRTLDRPHFEKRGIEKMVDEHTSGKWNHTTAINKILTLELICRLFIDA
jgi:asparagine synthase (glutamine-hydrolysing)